MTRTLERQMSGPVPSPSMNGMMGLSGTVSLPSRMVILAPCAGGVTFMVAAVDIDYSPGGSRRQRGVAGPEMLAQALELRPWRPAAAGARRELRPSRRSRFV